MCWSQKERLSDFQTWLFGSIHSESLQSKHQFLTSNASFEQAIISVAYSIYRREIVVLSCRKLKKRLKEPWASSKGSMTCRWWLVHISAVCFHPSILHSVIRASRANVLHFARCLLVARPPIPRNAEQALRLWRIPAAFFGWACAKNEKKPYGYHANLRS